MVYSTPDISNFVDLFQYVHANTGNAFGLLILISLFFVVFISVKGSYGTTQAFSASCFICMLISILLRILGLSEDRIVISFTLLLIISMVFLYLGSQEKVYV